MHCAPRPREKTPARERAEPDPTQLLSRHYQTHRIRKAIFRERHYRSISRIFVLAPIRQLAHRKPIQCRVMAIQLEKSITP